MRWLFAIWLALGAVQPAPVDIHQPLIALTSLESGVIAAHHDSRLPDAAFRRLIDATSGAIRTIVHAQTSSVPGATREACVDARSVLADAERSLTMDERDKAGLTPAIHAADDTLRRYLGASR